MTWDLPSNQEDIEKIYVAVDELLPKNRTLLMQILDKTIKKLDIPIDITEPSSVRPNSTVKFDILALNRYGQNSTSISYQLHVNIFSKCYLVEEKTFVKSCLIE